MNPLYNMYMSGMMNQSLAVTPQSTGIPGMNLSSMNPIQKMQLMMQAMANPAPFVRQAFPDIPAQIQNNPTQILQYLQQTRNISNEQIQNLVNQYPRPF